METTLKLLFHPTMTNGSLYGPWIPLYGIGTCIIIFLMRLIFNRFKVNRIAKIILLFIISTIILTILEFITGNILYLVTGKVFWNYSKLNFNIGKYICLEISMIWGIMSLVVIYIIKPQIDKLIKKIPSTLTYLILSIMFIDLIISIISY